MEVKMQDSLDSLCIQKQRAKEEKQRSLVLQIKQKFIIALQKLQSQETRQIGLAQIKKIIDRNREQQHLRIYISILKSLKPNSSSTTKQHQILVVSILTQLYRKNLLDPIDKPPSVMKSCFRLVQIIHSYFADTSGTVQQACARALLDITNYCLEGETNENLLSLIYAPLSSILRSGVDRASQATASVCINQLVQFWTKTGKNQIVEQIIKDILNLVLKLSTQYHQFFIALNTLIEFKGMSFFQNKLTQFIGKVLGILNSKKENNFNNYMCKVYVCKIMEYIGDSLSKQERLKFIDMEIQSSLQKTARNRIIQVQMAAHRALKAWKGQPKTALQAKTYSKPFVSLQEMRNNKKRQKSLSKDKQKEKMQSQITYLKQDLDKMLKGGFGAHQRAKDFVKKGSGIGGGFYGQADLSPPQKSNKSHKQHIDQLRDYIQKQSNQNKNKQKFQFYVQKQQRKQRSPTTNLNKNRPIQIAKGKRSKTPPSHPQNNQKRNKKYSDQGEFQIDMDTGDQMVGQKVRQNYNKQKTKKMNTQQIEKYQSIMQHVDKNQIKELLQHEKSLLEDQKNGRADRSIQLDLQSKASKHHRQVKNYARQQEHNSSNKMNIQFEKQMKKQQKLQQYYEDLIVPVQREVPKILKSLSKQADQAQQRQRQRQQRGPIKQKEIQRQDIEESRVCKKVFLSQQQLGDIIVQNNLSQVSQNLDSIINESDLKMNRQQLNMVDSNILGQQNQTAKIRSLIQQKSLNKSRNSLMKFMKKQERSNANLNEGGKDSLNFSQSKRSRHSPDKQFQLSPVKMEINKQFTLNPQPNQSIPHPQLKVHYVQSVQFRDKSNRFSSVAPIVHREQVDQQIVQSYFQESIPKEQRFRNVIRQANKIKIQDNIESSQEKGRVFQNVIKNPPKGALKSRFADKKSEMKATSSKGSQLSNNQYNYEKQEQTSVPITQQWIQILALIQNDQVNEAYIRTFEMDDPIYLLRLMLLTKTPLRKLTAEITSLLWKKFLQIYDHKFIDAMCVQTFTRANQMGMLKRSLSIQQLQTLLIQLYQISGTSKGKLSFNAAILYNSIEQSVKGRQNE